MEVPLYWFGGVNLFNWSFYWPDGFKPSDQYAFQLDIEIDVPELVNLVFFKPVYSKTKYWQMVGRGTRKSEDLFGPGLDKETFYLFDFCGNFEFFDQHPDGIPGSSPVFLSKKTVQRYW